ncbi:MAG: hypothetical protein NTW36_01535 [Planctomycetia bacterium]|nr:hypothetical protein [Planctomycetia bacterium]
MVKRGVEGSDPFDCLSSDERRCRTEPQVAAAMPSRHIQRVEFGEWPTRHISEHGVAIEAIREWMALGSVGDDAERVVEMELPGGQRGYELPPGPCQSFVDRLGSAQTGLIEPDNPIGGPSEADSVGKVIHFPDDNELRIYRGFVCCPANGLGEKIRITSCVNQNGDHSSPSALAVVA